MRLARHATAREADTTLANSAVAALLRGAGAECELLLMLRTEHPADPWSGHVSLPGGRRDPEDDSLLAAAVRETREEVGVDLERDARLLCRLDPVRAVGRGRVLPMDVTPFVFEATADVAPSVGPEAAEVFWLPLARVVSGELDSTLRWRARELPCWHYDGRVVWGLTHRMVQSLVAAASRGSA